MKFSIITPAYNMERWIAETIESVLSQEGDFEIEYIVVNDGSTDGTALVVQKYKKRIDDGTYPVRCNRITMQYFFQENAGAISAMNHGFSKVAGDICTWVDADNIFEPGAFSIIAKTFGEFSEIDWLKGITTTIDENGKKIREGKCKIYHQDWLVAGIYGQEAYFVEADSVFWRKKLWDKVGSLPSHFRSAGDYWLWIQFAKYSPLWSVNIPISNFRKRAGQLSKNISLYKREQWEARPRRNIDAWKARLFFSPQSRLVYKFPKIEPFFLWLYPIIFGRRKNEYIEIVNGTPVKNVMKSYRI